MHYVDEGGDGAPFLLIHGEPTSSYLWRNIIPQLPGRKVAPDLIGFGRSDKPEDIGWYSYDRHVDSITRLVDELGLKDITLVVHDWGGPIGLRFAVENPERVDAARHPQHRRRRRSRAERDMAALPRGRARARRRARHRSARRGRHDERPRRRDARRLRRSVPDARVEGRRACVSGTRPHRPRPPEHGSDESCTRRASHAGTTALVVWGADDAVLPAGIARAIVELIPGGRGPVTSTAHRTSCRRIARRGRHRDPRFYRPIAEKA